MRCPAAPDRMIRHRLRRGIRAAVPLPGDVAAHRPVATEGPEPRFRAPSRPSPTVLHASVHRSHRRRDAPTFRRLRRRTLWTDPLTEAALPPSSRRRISLTSSRIRLSTNLHTGSPSRMVRSRIRARTPTDRTAPARLPPAPEPRQEPAQRQGPEQQLLALVPITPGRTLSGQVQPTIQPLLATRTAPRTRTVPGTRTLRANSLVPVSRSHRTNRTLPASSLVPTPIRQHPARAPIPRNSRPSVPSPDPVGR